jgi:hypothetical protein
MLKKATLINIDPCRFDHTIVMGTVTQSKFLFLTKYRRIKNRFMTKNGYAKICGLGLMNSNIDTKKINDKNSEGQIFKSKILL